ncbi:MAG TPA: preprotein translocase subunit YajC [Flavobacteriaceae bacterium]|nr:preprotein translocase subunit YajC [Flavobacteriaceae bacterium]
MGDMSSFLPLILMFLVVYLFMIRPQMKRQKKEKQFIQDLKVGDNVVTKSGMHGKLKELSDDGTCIIETLSGRIKFERSTISMEMSSKDTAAKK